VKIPILEYLKTVVGLNLLIGSEPFPFDTYITSEYANHYTAYADPFFAVINWLLQLKRTL